MDKPTKRKTKSNVKVRVPTWLLPAEIEWLDAQRKLNNNGIVPDRSVYLRHIVLTQKALIELLQRGVITPGVMSRVREYMATKEAAIK